MSRLSESPTTGRRARGQSRGVPMERLMSVEEVAEYLGIPVNTLYQWRHKGTGPTAFRVGRFLRYDAANVREWLTEQAGAAHGLH